MNKYLKQIQSPVGISSSTKGGQWQVKWNEAGQESQQIKSPPSPQASQQSWLWPFPEIKRIEKFKDSKILDSNEKKLDDTQFRL